MDKSECSSLSSESEKKSLSHYRKKRRSTIEATVSEKVPIFSNLNQQKFILTDLEMELNQLRSTCDSLSEGSFKEETFQISG